MAFGVTAAGFVAKRLPDIKKEIEDALRETFGNGIDLTAESPLGQLVGVFSERETLIWELAEDVYDSAYPDTAEGSALDNVGAILGIARKGRSFSTVNVILYGDAGTVIPAGKRASVAGNPEAIFATTADVTIAAAIAEVQRVSFLFGPPASGAFTLTFAGQTTSSLPWNATAAAVQAALRALTNITDDLTVVGNTSTNFTITFAGDMAGIDQPLMSVADTLLDASAAAVFVFTSQISQGQPAQVAAAMKAINSGPVLAPTASLVVIETPVTGWDGLTNPFSAVIGNELETDAEYRLRRTQTLQRSGAGTIEAIRADVLNINGVTHAEVFENTSLSTDDDGLPAKSFRVLVLGGPDQQIADTIWKDKPAGIQSNGNTTIDIVDTMGYSHEINFSRPEEIPIVVVLNLTVDDSVFPANGADLASIAIAAKGNKLGIGDDVHASPFLIASLDGIIGINGATLTIDKGDGPESSIDISKFEIASFDPDDVEVNFL